MQKPLEGTQGARLINNKNAAYNMMALFLSPKEILMTACNKIVAARIEEPTSWGDSAKVFVRFEGTEHEEVKLFSYFNDEISFTASEFLGRTAHEARELRHAKDVAYLRS